MLNLLWLEEMNPEMLKFIWLESMSEYYFWLVRQNLSPYITLHIYFHY